MSANSSRNLHLILVIAFTLTAQGFLLAGNPNIPHDSVDQVSHPIQMAVGPVFPAGTTPNAIAISDFNSDGISDLAVADRSGGVDILLGTRTGSFLPAKVYQAGLSPVGIAAGDFNNDGKVDLAVTDSQSNQVDI